MQFDPSLPHGHSKLLDPRATALDQYDQHNHEKYTGYYPDNRG